MVSGSGVGPLLTALFLLQEYGQRPRFRFAVHRWGETHLPRSHDISACCVHRIQEILVGVQLGHRAGSEQAKTPAAVGKERSASLIARTPLGANSPPSLHLTEFQVTGPRQKSSFFD